MTEGVHVHHGDPDDLLYVDDDHRRCGTCNEVKPIEQFCFKPRYNESTIDCRKCLQDKREIKHKLVEAESEKKLVNALAKANARKALLDPAPHVADAVREVMKYQGGPTKVYKRAAKAIRRSMVSEDEDIARKSAMGMLSLIALAEKMQNESFDLNSLTPEDRIDILMEPAKQLILSDPEFRRILMNDPEIRNLLLSDAGVEVIEAQ